ncbi:MAG: signal peptidase I [Clostridiales bacterium]|nr:signal peptidase I [Clostridiales bacterium]
MLLYLFFNISYFRVYVVGTSMEGTLTGAESKYTDGGDYLYAFRTSSPRRGDIVVIENGNEPIIKRLIALGGDTVELKAGVLYLNGDEVKEAYVDAANNTDAARNTYPETVVPEGYMFFLGDNRDVSVDSRSEKYGMLPVSKIMGVVANWSLSFKGAVTSFNTFFDFKLGMRGLSE